MKQVTNYKVNAIYSDVPLPRKDVTILKYICKELSTTEGETDTLIFRHIGGESRIYGFSQHETYGKVIKFSTSATMWELSDEDVMLLTERGIIKE